MVFAHRNQHIGPGRQLAQAVLGDSLIMHNKTLHFVVTHNTQPGCAGFCPAPVLPAGVALRQLMRQARKRIARKNASAISTSVETFMEYLSNNSNLFRLMLQEKTGVSKPFRTAVKAEIDHFVTELADDLRRFAEEQNKPLSDSRLVAEAMVTLVFNQGAEALDATPAEKDVLKEKLKTELRMVLVGSQAIARQH